MHYFKLFIINISLILAQSSTATSFINEANPEISNTSLSEINTINTTENLDTHRQTFEHDVSKHSTFESVLTALNVTVINITEFKNRSEKLVSCIPNYGDSQIHLVNDTELIQLLTTDRNITNKEMPGNCVVIMFYSKYCPFSSMAAPHFNALPRAFPSIKMVAINAMWYHIFNAQNGVVGVPSILLFHNGKPVAKFNESEYTLELFSRFITKHTGILAEEKSIVTSADFSGPVVSVPSKEDDFILLLSWIFVLFCLAYYFSKSTIWRWIVETVQNTWRESEAQHEHVE